MLKWNESNPFLQPWNVLWWAVKINEKWSICVTQTDVSPSTACRAVDGEEQCQCSCLWLYCMHLFIVYVWTNLLLLDLFVFQRTRGMSLQSFLHRHDSLFSWIITPIRACWIPLLACSSSTDRYINMLPFKESLTSHQFWPHSLQCLEKTACD